jgi:hypothetical protein
MPTLRDISWPRVASAAVAALVAMTSLPAERVGAQQAGPDVGTPVQAFGDAAALGSPSSATGTIGMATTSTGDGYWVVDRSGQVTAFGDAEHVGDMAGVRLAAPIVDIEAAPDDRGYWLAGADGGVLAFGSATFLGSMGAVRLNQAIVGMAATPSGGGYWLVAADGGMFSFGDARFHGSMGGVRLNAPVVGMASSPTGGGYWLVATDGGIFTFGDAIFHGSAGAITLNQPIVAMASLPNGHGYWLAGGDGGVFSYGTADFHGSRHGSSAGRVVDIETTPSGRGYWLLATGAALGVFRGSGDAAVSQLPAYEEFLGRPVDLAVDYLGVDSWANQEFPDWQINAWAKRPDVRLSLGSIAFPTGGTWAEAASGAYDGHWRTLGQRLVASGHGDALLRFGHEFNEFFHDYQVNSANAHLFVASWRRFVDILRAVPSQQFVFVWNPSLGDTVTFPNPEQAWPGDGYVDQIGLDVYDAWYRGWRPGVDPQPSEAERDRVWNDQILNGARGLRFWREFAFAHGAKPLAFPEWGLQLWQERSDGLWHGGGDNARFIQRMHDLIGDPSWNVAWHSFWEQPGFGVFDPDASPARTGVPVPLSRDVYRTLF